MHIYDNLGTVSCWQIDSKQRPVMIVSNTTEHSNTITVLKWNPAGKRLITGDKVDIFKM